MKRLALVAILVLTGCVPMRVYDSPRLQVAVVDNSSGRPIAGASVIADLDAGRPISVSDLRGMADLPARSHLILMFPNIDPLPQSKTLGVSAAGYMPASRQICFYSLKNAHEPQGNLIVRLDRADSVTSPPARPGGDANTGLCPDDSYMAW